MSILRELNLFSLNKRCKRGDKIEIFKILKVFDCMDLDNLFELDNDGITRGHCLKLKNKWFNLDISKY